MSTKLLSFFFTLIPLHAFGSAAYTIPATSTLPAASWVLSDVRVTKDTSGNTILHYQLPEDIVGPKYEATTLQESTTNADGSINFTGEYVRSSICVESAITIQCNIVYEPYLLPTPASVASFLQSKYSNSPSDLAAKLNLSGRFLGDPEGVLLITK